MHMFIHLTATKSKLQAPPACANLQHAADWEGLQPNHSPAPPQLLVPSHCVTCTCFLLLQTVWEGLSVCHERGLRALRYRCQTKQVVLVSQLLRLESQISQYRKSSQGHSCTEQTCLPLFPPLVSGSCGRRPGSLTSTIITGYFEEIAWRPHYASSGWILPTSGQNQKPEKLAHPVKCNCHNI